MVGPVISRAAQQAVFSKIYDALAKGAVDATPVNESFRGAPREGSYVPPTLLIGTTHDMDVMREETFGPVIPVSKVSSDEEAVRMMNDTEYGLTASVWTTDIARGQELIELLDAGTVFVNRCDYPSPVCLDVSTLTYDHG
jgi:acyl-CoA reductase-like NAD-dependent aldehyde dehydrogenase